ncbi:MAG: hypothetical protein JJU13_12900 [Balneolaceae bacterium]|nr:hypothetical protein [Balneolaceae bacterium]
MQENHKKDEYGSHCDMDSCLIYYRVNMTGILIKNQLGDSIHDHDEFCTADLQISGDQ